MNRELLTEEFLLGYDNAVEAYIERKEVREKIERNKAGYHIKKKYFYSEKTTEVIEYEGALKKVLDRRTAREWKELIESVEDQGMQNRVACLIWWSFFGRHTRENYSEDLDGYLTTPYEWIYPELVAMKLWELGYSPYEAWQRAKLPKGNTKPVTKQENEQ